MTKKITFFAIALLLQLLILAAVPARQIHARLTGKLVTIKTAPVDPYDFLSGYHVILRYEISTPPKITNNRYPHTVYVILEPDSDRIYEATSTHPKMPDDIPDEAVVIKGTGQRSRVKYGIENYFIPEKNREVIEKDLRRNRRQAKAQIKIDKFGNPALIRLIIDDKTYEY